MKMDQLFEFFDNLNSEIDELQTIKLLDRENIK